MSKPVLMAQTTVSDLDAEINALYTQLKPGQAEELRVKLGFSRDTLERVLRQDATKKQLWIENAKPLIAAHPKTAPP
ncbi:MAG: hypothetical protein ACREQF_09525 [Candidatus Binataceae bacterium]